MCSSAYIDIAIALRDMLGGYTRHAGALFASLIENTSRPLRIHILLDDSIAKADRQNLASLACGKRIVIAFYEICLHQYFCGIKEHTQFSHAALFRFLLAEMPEFESINRIIYLDTDIIVDLDIAELWDENLNGALIGVVLDPALSDMNFGASKSETYRSWLKKVLETNEKIGIPQKIYFNSGVMLLDLDGIRKSGSFKKAWEIVLSTPQLVHPDQDALNIVFEHSCTFVDSKFNRMVNFGDVENETTGIWHYASKKKPWITARVPKAARYIYFLEKTPWAAMDIAVALSDDSADQVCHAITLIESIVSNTAKCIRLHVVYDVSLQNADKKKISSVLEGTNHATYFYQADMKKIFNGVEGYSSLKHRNLGLLLLPRFKELLHCKKIIYFDTNIIVNFDISTIWNSNLGDKLLGYGPAQLDAKKSNQKMHDRGGNFSSDTPASDKGICEHFDGSVLLLNLEEIRKQKLFQAVLQIVRDMPCSTHPCSDALSAVFLNRSLALAGIACSRNESISNLKCPTEAV